MNREDVIQLAREAECSETFGADLFQFTVEELERFAAAIEQRTLERAAQVCDKESMTPSSLWEEPGCWKHATENCAAAIRALKDTP